MGDVLLDYIDYSPDRQRVAFVKEGSKGQRRLFACGVDARDCEEMTPDWGPYEYHSVWWPRWSPDGDKIVFYASYYLRSAVSDVLEGIEGVFVVEVDTGEQRLLCMRTE
jgi:Tol biopolymer transport system component